jgi:glycyl-tRNA synthetase beta chain
MNAPLLLELFTEELPPKALKNLGEAFADSITATLSKLQLLGSESRSVAYASPRRLAVHITDVRAISPDQPTEAKLLPVSIGLDTNGNATAPLSKKMAALGFADVPVSALEKVSDGKQDQLVYRYTAPGKPLAQALQAALTQAIEKLPIPKVMSYQRPDGSTVHFVRPAHSLIALHAEAVIDISALGLNSGRRTQGHRFLGEKDIDIDHADHYENLLRERGKVIASFPARRAAIEAQLQQNAGSDTVVAPDALIDEVTALVEWPCVYAGHFEESFLEVPQECLILTMQANQKYFALTDAQGRMRNRFLLVSNLQTDQPQTITSGNERVLRARLSDARFFFQQDRKKPLEARLAQLGSVVYHNQLGTQAERVKRISTLAGQLAPALGLDAATATRAASLAKADLVTDMVGEFPELQGIMGMYYARHDGEAGDIPQSIEDHYHPRFAGDTLPKTQLGMAVALADKLETLVGIYGIGLVPTGDRDPFALRRHALGIIRMLMENKLDINVRALLTSVRALFADFPSVTDCDDALYGFVLDRLRGYLRDRQYNTADIEAVLALQPARFNDIITRLDAVRAFRDLPEAEALASANKRISNILRKAGQVTQAVDSKRLTEAAEQQLWSQLGEVSPVSENAFGEGRYADSLQALARLKPSVDAFFNDVMVMAEDMDVRNNRLALLQSLHTQMNRVADLSQLAAG